MFIITSNKDNGTIAVLGKFDDANEAIAECETLAKKGEKVCYWQMIDCCQPTQTFEWASDKEPEK